MTLETLMARLDNELTHGPIDVREFVGSYHPHDVEVGQLLMGAFAARLLRGRVAFGPVEIDGHISSIADDTRPVWH